MKNLEYYNEKPLREAMAKYDEDFNLGADQLSFYDWLDSIWRDPSKNMKWINHELTDMDEYLAEREKMLCSGEVTGYLLELRKKEDGVWEKSEFDVCEDSNIWGDGELSTEFLEKEIHFGFYSALPADVMVMSSDDWDYRLGVDFDARCAVDIDRKIWGGIVTSREVGEAYDLWRVTKITIPAEMSDRAKAYFREHLEATWEPTIHN